MAQRRHSSIYTKRAQQHGTEQLTEKTNTTLVCFHQRNKMSIPMRNVNGFRQRGDIPEMQKKDYQRCHCAETVEITLTTVSSARIRRYHAPEILCLQQNIGASIRGPNYFLNTHTLVSGRAHDTTWDKDKKLLRWSEQEQNWF